jgi:LysM repeat protein
MKRNEQEIIDEYFGNDDISSHTNPSPKKFSSASIGIICLVVFIHIVGVGCVIGLTPTEKFAGKEQPTVSSNSTKSNDADLLREPIPESTPEPIEQIAKVTPEPQKPLTPEPQKPVVHKPVTPVTTTTSNGLTKTYTIQKGDTVISIAKKYKLNTDRLMKINDIKDPTKLRVGQTLKFM